MDKYIAKRVEKSFSARKISGPNSLVAILQEILGDRKAPKAIKEIAKQVTFVFDDNGNFLGFKIPSRKTMFKVGSYMLSDFTVVDGKEFEEKYEKAD